MFNGGLESTKGEHSPNCHCAGLSIGHCQKKLKNPGLTVDYFEEIAERAEELALKDHSVKPGKIWKIIWKEMVAKNHTWKGLNNRQVMNKIHNVRKADGDTPRQIFEKLEYPNLRTVKKSNNDWWQFTYMFNCNVKPDKIRRAIGWQNLELNLCARGSNIDTFIDGTCPIILFSFYQCLIIMVYCQQTKLYVPVMYVLMTEKTISCYMAVLNWMVCCIGLKSPQSVTYDFEKSLHTAVQQSWLMAFIIRCHFHRKQAMRQKLKKILFDNDFADKCMAKNVMDVLTIIPRKK